MIPSSIYQVGVVVLFLVHIVLSDHGRGDAVYAKDGDLILGGLFPMHNFDVRTQSCADIREPRALKTVEAMAWVIDKINNDTTLLPDYTLGFEIHDTCFYDIWALGKSINFLPSERTAKGNCSCNTKYAHPEDNLGDGHCAAQKNIVGVVGATRSAASIQAATLFGLHQIPQISYQSTSDELSNRFAYPYFFRVVPPDRHQVEAIIDIILHYGWTYVSFLYSDDDYGRNGNTEFTEQAKKSGICIAWTQEISDYFTKTEMETVVRSLRREPYNRAVVVVLFMHLEEGKLFFETVLNQGVQNEFTWLASDGIGSFGLQGLLGVEPSAKGLLSVVPFSERLAEYDQYMITEGLLNTDNPWVEEYIESYTNCTINGICGNGTNPTDTLVMDSVYAFAHALESLLKDHCGLPQHECTAPYNGELLLKYLSNTSFESLANGWIEFNEAGEGSGRYAINHIVKDKLWDYDEIRVGEWSAQNSERLDITDLLVRFYTNDTQGKAFRVPKSTCSTECDTGYAKRIFIDFPCCWDCQKCHDNQAVINETQCVACEPPEWPDLNRTSCELQDPVYMSWNRWDGVILIVLASLGILLALISTIVYLANLTHPFISNSDPIPTMFIMLGIFICLTSCLLVAIPPTVTLCYLVRLLPGIGLALMFYPFSLKCVRLYRIFRQAKKSDSTKEPDLLNIQKQIIVIMAGLILQVGFALTWIIIIPPEIEYLFEASSSSPNGVELHKVCNLAYTELITEIIISGPMLLLSCLFTFLARQLPDNSYEARNYAFSAYAALIIAIAFNLTYLTLNEPYGKMFYRYMGIHLIAIVFMFCVFIVRLYTVYFVMELKLDKNRSPSVVSGIWRTRTRTTSSTVPITRSRRNGNSSSTGSTPDGIMADVAIIESTYL
ncbi:metabotropic glutamate receptor 7-like [Amphiura filiformis]|uniref:metabotropic glutamate receptor 7-like n=1 Tax=Amphiura filiformis TaxID=82378 RepID=UPI003B22652B